MKIAILSDIHENSYNLDLALEKIDKAGVEKIICLGDLINTGIARILSKSKAPVFSLWGNNDGEKVLIMRLSLENGSNLTMSNKTHDFLEVGGRKIFIAHYDDIAPSMARSGDYDAVFYGHDHVRKIEKIGNCLLLNPGEISGHKSGAASFAIYDAETNDGEIFEIENPKLLK